MGPRVGLDECGKSRPTGIRSTDRPARSGSLYIYIYIYRERERERERECRDSAVGIATRYGLDGPGIESQWGEIFRTRPDRPWDPPSLPYITAVKNSKKPQTATTADITDIIH